MTEWFNREPGNEIDQSQTDPTMFINSDCVPDWVRIPGELGGGQRRVLKAEMRKCLRSDHSHECVHYDLDGNISVCECLTDRKFYWKA